MRFLRLVKNAVVFLVQHGSRAFLRKALDRGVISRHRIQMPVSEAEARKVDWTHPPQTGEHATVSETRIAAWIMSPPGETSGGHQNLFRFIDVMERAGWRTSIHFYSNATVGPTLEGIRKMLANSPAFARLDAEILEYDPARGVGQVDALFATGWETAYPVFLDPSSAKRFYFVQDFEPGFYPLGSEYILAENTYRFGFHGITAGGWLAAKLSDEYGMRTDHFDFGVDRSLYRVTNHDVRDEVFFYARPVTARRGFELGALALAEFAELRPDVTINLAGWDVSNWDLPFRYKNLAGMKISELNAVYNRCRAGLVISTSNMSLLPLELMSSGTIPVVNDGENNRMVSDNPFIEYVPPVPALMADRLAIIMAKGGSSDHAQRISDSLIDVTWTRAGEQFMDAFTGAMRG